MSEKLQDNPFAALFSSVKDAEQFSQQHLPSKTQPPTSKEQVHKSENDNTVSFLEHLLLVTTRGEWPHTAPRVLLPSTDPLTVDSFPLLLFTRLLLDPSEIELVGPQGEGGDEAAQSEVVVYLSEVYSRCWTTRDRPGHIARKVMEAVVTNLATALEQPELYPSQKVEQQMLRVLQQGLGREGAVEDLARNLVTHISKERAAAPPRVFEQLLAEVTTKLGSCSLMAVDFSLIEILEFYATLPLLAPLLTRIPPEQETRMGRSFHKTPLGSLLSISSLPDHAGLPSPFFDKPSSKPGHIHKDTEKSIWLAQRNINIRIHKIFYKLLKVSSQAKDGLLSWLESCLQANRGRAGIWHLQGIEGGLQSIYASDGFMINLGAVMLQLAQPFTQDVKSAKILKVDPTYCKARPMREEGGVPGAYTKGFENLSTLVPHSEEDSVLPHSQQYSFISSCFFLTHRALHLGMQVAQQKLSKLSQELGRLHQNEAVAEVMQPYVEARTADLLSLKAALFEPHLTESLLQFLGSTTEWMVQISLSPTNQLTPPTTLKEVTLPLPDEEEEMPHPFLQCIPEFLVENLTEAISSVRHYTAGLLDAAGDSAILSQLMSFIVVFMGSSKRMSNPHLRAQLASCLEILLPESKNSSGGLLIGLQEHLFQSHPLSSQLVSTLLNVFVSIEMTGQNVAFEEKFGYRRPMYEVMKYLWELPHHRQKFTELATEALSNMESARPPLFLRFVNLLINDAIYLLDEGLSYMSQLRESQKERDGGEWDSLTPAQRESRERSFQNMMLLARFHNNLGSHTIQILIRLTKEIPQMFTHSTLVDRMAAMLNYFLSTLVGPKQRNLKVRYMEKYEFRPGEMVSDICTIYTHLFANSSFCLAVSSDGRSYTPQLFSQASDVLCRVGRGLLAEEMQEVGRAVVAAGKAQAEDDDIAAEAPEEFLDPIMSHLMTDPVILPSSKLTVDRQTIARHLLSDQIDPFNRQPLTMEEVVPNTELKIRITQWLDEKRTQRAALSQIPKPQ
uniref:Ubiquitin conjugation factor E4 A n=1 Tax=Scylla olivacea TaxID=85551 RepID=A0A0P4VWG4_SCYOL